MTESAALAAHRATKERYVSAYCICRTATNDELHVAFLASDGCMSSPMQAGDFTYTCNNGNLENPSPPTCSPTCATIDCTEQRTTYYGAEVFMRVKPTVSSGDICVGECKAFCCEGTSLAVIAPPGFVVVQHCCLESRLVVGLRAIFILFIISRVSVRFAVCSLQSCYNALFATTNISYLTADCSRSILQTIPLQLTFPQ
jgi:hypothetical protein